MCETSWKQDQKIYSLEPYTRPWKKTKNPICVINDAQNNEKNKNK